MFNNQELLTIRDLCLAAYHDDVLDDYDYMLLNMVDKIEKELGIE